MDDEKFLQLLQDMEDLLSKKTKIYSRLLTDVALAKGMEERAKGSDERRERIENLLYPDKPKKAKDGGMSATNGEKE